MVSFRNQIRPASTLPRDDGNDDACGGGGGDGDGEHLFVVDMDLTSQGDMCEEISHLSDPTHVVLHPPLGRVPAATVPASRHRGGGQQQQQHRRRMAATTKNLLKKPIAAIRQSFGVGNGGGGNGTHNRARPQPRNATASTVPPAAGIDVVVAPPPADVVGPVLDDEPATGGGGGKGGGGGGASPLTMVVPGRTVFGHPSDAENRNPNRGVFRAVGPPGTHAHGGCMLLREKLSVSWEDDDDGDGDGDPLLVVDDSAPATPRGLDAAAATERTALVSGQRMSSLAARDAGPTSLPHSRRPNPCCFGRSPSDHVPDPPDAASRPWTVGTRGGRGSGRDACDRLLRSVVRSWGLWASGVSFALLVVSAAGRPRTAEALVDVLYGAVVSVTTVGPATSSSSGDAGTHPTTTPATTATMEMLCTMAYAVLGVTSVGIFWGNHAAALLRRARSRQSRREDSVREAVLALFCDPPPSHGAMWVDQGDDGIMDRPVGSNGGNLSSAAASAAARRVRRQGPGARRWASFWRTFPSSRSARIWSVPCLVVGLVAGTGAASGWTAWQCVCYAVLTACTLGPTPEPQTPASRAAAILLVPLAVALTLRWWLAIARWMVKPHTSAPPRAPRSSAPGKRSGARGRNPVNRKVIAVPSHPAAAVALAPADVGALLERARLEEGLLTRADFLEVMLLAMGRVDPDLIVDLRNGFDRVTQGGEIDLTRGEWVGGTAARAAPTAGRGSGHDPEAGRRQDENNGDYDDDDEWEDEVSDPVRNVAQSLSDWLLGEGGNGDRAETKNDQRNGHHTTSDGRSHNILSLDV